MPIYEYECQQCGIRFERLQKFSDLPVTTCPECEGDVKRLIHPVGIVFKGSGWYVTDSRAKSPTTEPVSKKSEKNKNEVSAASSSSSEDKAPEKKD